MINSNAQKLVLLGDMAVGKTSIALRLSKNIFSADYVSTIGVKMHKISVDLPEDETGTVVLWDTDGEFGEHIFETIYLRGAAGALLVSDLTRPKTVEHMMHLAGMIEDYLPGRPCLCVLNKADMRAPEPELIERVRQVSDFVAVTSAKTGEGVSDALIQLYRLVQERMESDV